MIFIFLFAVAEMPGKMRGAARLQVLYIVCYGAANSAADVSVLFTIFLARIIIEHCHSWTGKEAEGYEAVIEQVHHLQAPG